MLVSVKEIAGSCEGFRQVIVKNDYSVIIIFLVIVCEFVFITQK